MTRLRLLLFMLLLLPMADATAQRSYSGNTLGCDPGAPPQVSGPEFNADRGLGVCDPNNSVHQLQYMVGNQELGRIALGIRSCWSWWYNNVCLTDTGHEVHGRYSVDVDGPKYNQDSYFLTGNNGDRLPVQLEFLHPARVPAQLKPDDNETNTRYPPALSYPAGMVSIRVLLAPGFNPTADSYSGDFDLYVYQCEWWGTNPSCKNFSGQGGAPASLAQPVRLHVELNPATMVRISGLEDMLLDGTGTRKISASQSFCVFTTDGVKFNLTGDSLNGKDQFLLQGTTVIDDSVPYSVQVQQLGSSPKPKPLSEGRVAGERWSGHPQENCNGQENMQITIDVDRKDLSNPQDSQYSDVLTLFVEAE